MQYDLENQKVKLDILKISRDPSLAMAKLIDTTSTLDTVNMS